jgi:hypothetical protein
MGISPALRRAGLVAAMAAIAAPALMVVQPGVARAYVSPPSFTVSLSPDNVVPGPGQPGAQTADVGVNFDGQGGLCWWMDTSVLTGPTTVGIYQGAAGGNGPLVVPLKFYWQGSTCQIVDQTVLDAIEADAAGFYLQIASTAYPDGATRGQLELVLPTNVFDVSVWLCSPGTKFPVDRMDLMNAACGSVVLPQDVNPPWPGTTTIGFGGGFPIDFRVDGPEGFSQTIDRAIVGYPGGWCNPETLICTFGLHTYEWSGIPLGSVTVTPLAGPDGASFAYTDLVTPDEGVSWTRGPNHSVTVDLSEQYFVEVEFFYVAPDHVTTPLVAAPTVEVGTPEDGSASVPLTVTSAAQVRGPGGVRYQLQMSKDGRPFHMASMGTSPVSVVNVAASHTYRFRVRALDWRGGVSDWAEGSDVTV